MATQGTVSSKGWLTGCAACDLPECLRTLNKMPLPLLRTPVCKQIRHKITISAAQSTCSTASSCHFAGRLCQQSRAAAPAQIMLSCRISSADSSSKFLKCYFEGDHLVPLTAQLPAPLNNWTQRIISQANCTDVQQGCFWAQGLPHSISEPLLASLRWAEASA